MRKRILAFILASIMTFTPITYVLAKDNVNGNVNVNTSANSSVRNSINMLNYLAVTTVDINASDNGKLYLEEVYNSLINNTNPEAVDDRTQRYLKDMLQVLDSYRMIEVKRERLEYIYDKQKASAIHEAMPNPLGLLSAASSFDLKRVALSFVYMAVDSVNSYDKALDEAEEEYLKSGWELDDQQQETLNKSREDAFDYMIDITQYYGLGEENSLNEKEIQEFVEKKNLSNTTRKLEFLVDNQETYKELGEYWLVLAETYYQEGEYKKCLNATKQYKDLEVGVLRKDYDYAQILPFAILSAQESYTQSKYVSVTEDYLSDILTNIDNDDWDLRYFAAQTYIDLYSKTQNDSYLQKAYDCAKSNVNELIDEQLKMNETYLADIQKVSEPKGATDAQKKEIKNYNKFLEQERKTEVPPVSEPLMLNLDLLFALADEINISDSQKNTINKMLHPDDNPIFLSSTLDNLYRFETAAIELQNVKFEGGKITFPAEYISDVSQIKITVKSGSDSKSFEDWSVDSVKRTKIDKGTDRDITSISATYSSTTAKKYDYKDGDIITIELKPNNNADAIILKFENQPWKKGFITSPIDNFVRVS